LLLRKFLLAETKMSDSLNPIFPSTRSRVADTNEDIGSNPTGNASMGDVIGQRFGRRNFLRGALATTAIGALPGYALLGGADAVAQVAAKSSFDFEEVVAGADDKHHVAQGYDADILIRWGDPVLPNAPVFDPMKQSAAAQKLQFGYNNDFLGYLPMPGAPNGSKHGLLCVNHEYTNEELMFPGLGGRQDLRQVAFRNMTQPLAEIELAAHGGSVIEVRNESGKWGVVQASRYARRIHADTVMEITGPAAGHPRMRTKADPEGRRVLGMFNNCAGGMTPWGTWLTCEENINGIFWGRANGHPEEAKLRRYGIPGNWYNWGVYFDRFDVAKEPNEPNRFGWIVEIDPLDPASTPKKRTALGRYKREGAGGVVNRDGRFVVYSGDDERFDYVYKFVTEGRVDPANRAANMDLLDKGTLYVAKYNSDGTGEWLPLVHGQGPLTTDKGFASQADVVIDTRLAGDALGATKMDRPEDIDVSPTTGKVYLMLTNNTRRTAQQVDAANPRANNRFGHIIEMTPDGGDHAAAKFKWEILVKGGNPADPKHEAAFGKGTTDNGWFGMPDNGAFDPSGRLWVATDGMSRKSTGRNDGLWAVETEGPQRGMARGFFRVPDGAELCGPCFTPDGETLFVAIQHPGEGGEETGEGTFENPSTRWPDFKPDMPPRPSIVVITKKGGGKIA
jgi:secreted PhoX family phosphatase